jgi:acetyl esterase/lipase
MLNRAGFHAAVLTYTTAATDPGVDAYPQALFDLADAICTVRVNAYEWAVDQRRIGVLGFSAGGWICAMYETHWNTALFSGHGTPEERQPNAAVLCYPLVDYRGGGMIKRDEADMEAVLGEGAAVQMKAFQAAVDKALLGDRELTDELVREISPTDHISDGTPPTFVWTTFGDGLLDPLQSLEYARKLHTSAELAQLLRHCHIIIISRQNLPLLSTRFSYNDYEEFYQQTFIPLTVSDEQLLNIPETTGQPDDDDTLEDMDDGGEEDDDADDLDDFDLDFF